MKTYQKAIDYILKFKSIFDEINPKIPKKLVDALGEYYVLRELERYQFGGTEHKSGQQACDIFVGEFQKRIEVKTSLLKNEDLYDKKIEFWGWTIKKKRGLVKQDTQKERKFDLLVGVALDEAWKVPKFYIFTFEEASTKNETVNLPWLGSVEKKIHVFQNSNDLQIAKNYPYLTEQEIRINENQSEFINRWDKIRI